MVLEYRNSLIVHLWNDYPSRMSIGAMCASKWMRIESIWGVLSTLATWHITAMHFFSYPHQRSHSRKRTDFCSYRLTPCYNLSVEGHSFLKIKLSILGQFKMVTIIMYSCIHFSSIIVFISYFILNVVTKMQK